MDMYSSLKLPNKHYSKTYQWVLRFLPSDPNFDMKKDSWSFNNSFVLETKIYIVHIEKWVGGEVLWPFPSSELLDHELHSQSWTSSFTPIPSQGIFSSENEASVLHVQKLFLYELYKTL